MAAQPKRWAFVVPGEEIAVHNPALVQFLGQSGKTWDEFVYLATAEVLGYINQQRSYDFNEVITLLSKEEIYRDSYQFHTAQVDTIVTQVIAGFDLVDTDLVDEDGLGGMSETLAEKQYAILYPAVVHVLKVILRYIALMFKEPRQDHGIPYEITLDRLIGKDLVFTIAYL